MKLKLITLTLLFIPFYLLAQKVEIIPQPNSIIYNNGYFTFDNETEFVLNNNLAQNKAITNSISFLFNKKSIPHTNKTNRIELTLKKSLQEEEYELVVSKEKITLRFSHEKGAFYGLTSLFQLTKNKRIPALVIKDSPRFKHRGFMLDVTRHFFPIDEIKKFIDVLSFYKINNLHLHLTDDQGWRIEIKKYPKLQEIAAFRDETLIGHLLTDTPHVYKKERYGGYYTQEQLKDLVAYANSRFINIIPEIETPGHATAAIAAYPQLGCTNNTNLKPSGKWGIFEDIYCPKEETFEFLENVLLEVINIFPSKYIHIGGDEVPFKQWKNSEIAQKVMKENNLRDEQALHNYFINRIGAFLRKHNREIIGWDEIIDGGKTSKNATVMSWRGEKGGIASAKMKRHAIMAPHPFMYFDQYQTSKNIEIEPLSIGGYLNVDSVYKYNPTPPSLSNKQKKYIKGIQANLWTEYIKTSDHLESMAFPRALALSEIAWTQEKNKNFNTFSQKLRAHQAILDSFKINYSKYFFQNIH